MFRQLDLGKVSLADGLEEAVLADVRLFTRSPGGDTRRTAIGTLQKRRGATISRVQLRPGHIVNIGISKGILGTELLSP